MTLVGLGGGGGGDEDWGGGGHSLDKSLHRMFLLWGW